MHESKKIDLWQVVRGICIICVVQIHCLAGTGDEYSSVEQVYYLIVRNLINFPVPIFFFISGYFVAYILGNTRKRTENGGGYYWNRILRLLVPYLVWSIIYSVFDIFRNDVVALGDIVFKLCLGKVAVPFYYIIVLMYFTLLTPILIRTINIKSAKLFPFIISIGLLIILYILQLMGISSWEYVHYTPVWLVFYYGGIYFFIKEVRIDLKKRSFAGLIVIAFIFEMIENIWISHEFGYKYMAYGMIRIAGFIYSWLMCLLAYKACRENENTDYASSKLLQILKKIGDYSYGIFYIHYLLIIVISFILRRMNISSLVMFRMIEVCGSIVFSYLAIQITVRIIGKRCARFWLGF